MDRGAINFDMTSNLTFDEDQHEYRLGDRRLPSVTQVIRASVKGWQAGDFYLQRGSAVHKAVALAIEDRLDWSTVDERIVGRTRAILKFLEDTQLVPVVVEHRLASQRYQFAGCLDYVGCAPIIETDYMILDWKGSLTPESFLQLGGYQILWSENRKEPITRAALIQCRDDATYKCAWLTRRELKDAANTFLSFLTVHGWREKHGLNREGFEKEGLPYH